MAEFESLTKIIAQISSDNDTAPIDRSYGYEVIEFQQTNWAQ